jgi:hypothetical protein
MWVHAEVPRRAVRDLWAGWIEFAFRSSRPVRPAARSALFKSATR